jgi:hypothetical protein
MSAARSRSAPPTVAREIDDTLRAEIRRIAHAIAENAEGFACIGSQLGETVDAIFPDLSAHDLERKSHALCSAADYASRLVNDLQRLAGRLEMAGALRRAQAAAE